MSPVKAGASLTLETRVSRGLCRFAHSLVAGSKARDDIHMWFQRLMKSQVNEIRRARMIRELAKAEYHARSHVQYQRTTVVNLARRS